MRQFGGFIGRSVNGFMRDSGGNFAVMFGAVVAVLAMGIGFGVDTMQMFSAKSALRGALDAAVTSTARDLTTGVIQPKDADASVMAFITANSTGGMLSYNSIVLDDLDVDPLARTVTAAAHVDVDLFFPLFGMEKTRRVSDTNTAAYSDKKIEVAMMLDLTGSMKQNLWQHTDKIGDLRDAATIAVETFLGLNNPASPRVRVALVPYADGVNTGPLANTVFREADNSTGKADAPPPLTAARAVSAGGSNCASERKDSTGRAIDFSDAGPGTAMVNQDDRLVSCPASALVPLTTDQDKLIKAIGNFRADGFTAGHIGIQWTRYLLSPKWRGTLEAAVSGSGPAEYTDKKAKKIAILMTDGLFNTAFAGVPANEETRNEQAARSQAAAMTMCQRMKLDKIEVFTVGFMLDDPSAKVVMQKCASDDYGDVRHYYLAADGAALKAAFREIAANAETLVLTR
jgi:Flp pilus assembly protein TadG